MKPTARMSAIIAGLVIFLGLPLVFYALGEAPRRSILKEAFSILTLLAFSLMIGQFFLARSNEALLSLFKPPQIQKVHKYIAYSAVAVILLHPVLIVLPRAFEGGVTPWGAFLTMITTLDSLGILLGIAGWILLLVLVVTAYFRTPLMKRFTQRYRGWRYFHGGLAVAVTSLGLWHAIELGRHTDIAISAFYVSLTLVGFALLARLYLRAHPNKPRMSPVSEGAAS
ncbi:ferric reductase-like transmembrane domain-containing protein [Labrenzia sp. 011]|uniref:ferric reductase-like transmembrane domain-containing protein n=1 Tax=Labrenzia sp. 011 TaxID=2171494 RepID=UPI00140359E2|nr:ferric reductase-like transmembrane domain-containing protein [Labrenzia sp. 011]